MKNFNVGGKWVACPRCEKKNAMTLGEWPGPCEECKSSDEYKKELEEEDKDGDKSKSPAFHRYKDVTAFGRDKETGKPVAVDKKGKRVEPSETRYNFQKDPHGWRAAGYKVKEQKKKKK